MENKNPLKIDFLRGDKENPPKPRLGGAREHFLKLTQPKNNFQRVLLWAGWVLMAFMACYLSFITFIYFSFRSDIYFLLAKQDVVHHLDWRTAFYIHITGGLIALAIGPFQFLKKFRKSHLQIHRVLGRIYVGAILLMGGPAGFYMSLFAEGGFWARISFGILSFLWITFTLLGLHTILKKNITAHKEWMIRSFAITFSAVTLRLWVPVLSLVFHLRSEQVLFLSPWLAWVPNLLVAQCIIFLKRRKKLASKIKKDYNQSQELIH